MTIVRSITEIQDAWNGLKLELLEPVKLLPAQLTAIRRAQETKDVRHLPPIEIAKIPDHESAMLVSVARGLKHEEYFFTNSTAQSTKVAPEAIIVGEKFHRDVTKIQEILFPSQHTVGQNHECRIGMFRYALAGALHADYPGLIGRIKGITYAARVGALPIQVIDKTALTLSQKLLYVPLQKTGVLKLLGEYGRSLLRKANILRPVPLGSVVMMPIGWGGTQHCSSPVSENGSPSAFLSSSYVNKLSVRI